MSLEDKFVEHITENCFEIDQQVNIEQLAKDLAEIAEKEQIETTKKAIGSIALEAMKPLQERNRHLEKENKILKDELEQNELLTSELQDQFAYQENKIQELQAKLDSIKYLDRGEVEKICVQHLFFDEEHGNPEEFITAICSLAIPEIDREKIVEDIKAEFIREFCNDHAQMRWLRGVAFDMQDLLEKILTFLDEQKAIGGK